MRADRLLSIMLLLQVHERLTAAELAERLHVSERTILRDMDALSGAGIPLIAERGAGGGWRLIEGYRTHLTGLTAEEVQSLFFARPSDALAELGLGDASRSAWLKLTASLGEHAREQATFVRQRILVDSRSWRDSSQALMALPKLIEALWRGRQVRFDYESALHERGERLVDPLGIVAKGSRWYLVASRDGALRTYRVARIDNIVVDAAAAVRPADFDLAKYWDESAARFRERLPESNATYLVDPKVLHWIRYKGWRVLVEVDEGSRMRVRVRFDSDDEAVQLALAHGPDVELVEPIRLRQAVCEAATATVEKYRRSGRETTSGALTEPGAPDGQYDSPPHRSRGTTDL
jgi:predicted DNA-binding transcriptional regulator YafY